MQRQFVLEDRIIHGYLPDAKVTTMALPYGVMPDDPALALAGSWNGTSYQFDAVMLVGAEPAPSPFSKDFDPGAIPRIRSWPTSDLENGSTDWLDRLAPTRSFATSPTGTRRRSAIRTAPATSWRPPTRRAASPSPDLGGIEAQPSLASA